MKYVKILIIVLLVGLLLFLFLRNINFGEVFTTISSVNILYPVLFVAGLYSQYFIRSYRWGLILKPHKEKIPLITMVNYTSIGFFLNTIIPGKVGEAARGILLAGEQNFNRSYGLASVVIERLLDALVMFLLFFASLFFIPDSNIPLLKKLKIVALFISPLVLSLFFLFYYLNTEKAFTRVEKTIRFLSRLLPERMREKAIHFAIHFVKGLHLDLNFWGYVRLLFVSILVWVYLIPFYWILMKGFPFGAGVGLVETTPYFCILLASASIPTPGMAGSFDAISRIALEGLYGVSSNQAAAYTILSHFLILMVMVVPGSIAFWVKGINLKTIKGIKATETSGNNPNEMP